MQPRPRRGSATALAGLICVLALLATSTRAGLAFPIHAASMRLSPELPAGADQRRATPATGRPLPCTGGMHLTPGPCGQFFGVAMVSSSDVWAVGRASGPLIEHWDGRTWRLVPSPSLGQDGGELRAIAALSAHDIWAVGDAGSLNSSFRTLIEHWDGRRWSVVPSPTPPDSGGYSRLFGVAAAAPNDVWAVGEGPLIEHWDGARWRIIPHAAGGSVLLGVAAVSAHDVWAVGDAPTIEHWDGVRWRVVTSPSGVPHFALGADVTLNAITAVSARDIWAVGSYDAANCCRAGSGPLTEHWDGVRWRIVSSPNIPHSVEGDIAGITFSGVAAVSTRDVWAVGDVWRLGTGLEHWNGRQWHIVPNPVGPGSFGNPASVAAISTRDVWAVGVALGKGNQEHQETLAEHWDGQRWRVIPTPNTVL